MKAMDKKTKDTGKMLDDHAEEKRYERRAYRNAVLAPVTTFLVGSILSALFKAFGFGCALFGLVLCALGFLLAFLFFHD